MKLLKIIICFVLVLVYRDAYTAEQSLLIFLDTPGHVLSDEGGMNVAHQTLTAIVQQAAPVLIAQDVWNHIIKRQQRFEKGLALEGSVEQQINLLYQTTNQMIKQGIDKETLNQTLDRSWYKENFPQLADLSDDLLKKVMFDFFCYVSRPMLNHFSWYRVQDSFLLGLPHHAHHGFLNTSLQKLSSDECAQQFFNNRKVTLLQVLENLLDIQAGCRWNFYMTGHGHRKDDQHNQAIISGLSIHQFRDFLLWINSKIVTNLLVYSSCYSAGTHLVEPYQQDGKPLKLHYPVIVTCLTDSPTYTFGLASGIKLPPYDQQIFLESWDIHQQGLSWYFMQNFSKFVQLAGKKNRYKECAYNVSAYKECNSSWCTLSKLENIPLIRYSEKTVFVPIDSSFVQAILHDSGSNRIIDQKDALLWYVKEYHGTIIIQNKLPQFVSMIPGDGVFMIHRCDASSYNLRQIILQSFFSIDELVSQQIFIFDHINCRLDFTTNGLSGLQRLHNVMIVPAGKFQPIFVPKNSLGSCFFTYAGKTYWVTVQQNQKLSNLVILDAHQKKLLERFKKIVYQDIAESKRDNAESLLMPASFNHRTNVLQHQLQKCIHQKVCAKNIS